MFDIDKYDLALAFFLVGPAGVIIFAVAMCRAAARGDREQIEAERLRRRAEFQERECRVKLSPERTVTISYYGRGD